MPPFIILYLLLKKAIHFFRHFNDFTRNVKKFFCCSLYNISPKLLLRVRFLSYYKYYRKLLSFRNPITLDEKIQWMKVNYYKDNPLISQCADKYAVREYVKKMDCEEILIDLYGVYDNAKEIPWGDLPEKFVIKWNCGCGQNLIVKDKSNLNIEDTIKAGDDYVTHQKMKKKEFAMLKKVKTTAIPVFNTLAPKRMAPTPKGHF